MQAAKSNSDPNFLFGLKMFYGLAKLELTVLLLLTGQLFFVLLLGLLKNKYQTTQRVCLCTQMLYSHCEKYCHFT